jgi:deazaflavin-dependent oxidoreductase (nitroreductase family)
MIATTLRSVLRRGAIRALGRVHRGLYRSSCGHLLGSVRGIPVLLLTTTGRRSGKQRTTPLLFFRDGADLVVIASNGGEDKPPAWWLNLQQQPRCAVTINGDEIPVTAAPASTDDHARLWAEITTRFPGYAAYQRRTTRPIPVVILSPQGNDAS